MERIQAYRAMAHLRYPPSEPPSGLAEASDQPAVEVRHVRDGVFQAFGVERVARWIARRVSR